MPRVVDVAPCPRRPCLMPWAAVLAAHFAAACSVYDPALLTRRDASASDGAAADTPPPDDAPAPGDAPTPGDAPGDGAACGPSRTRCGDTCVDPQTDPAHCGDCATACGTPANGTATCTAGTCALACNAGYGDCDGMAANGCEANLSSDPAHCGACANACPTAPNTAPVCAAGTCSTRCLDGFADCDGMASNGCEASLTAPATCGSCTTRCPATAPVCAVMGTTAMCSTGCTSMMSRCGSSCVDTRVDPNNCGACGNRCPVPPNASATCVAGVCNFTCAGNWGDCDRNATNGCETDLTSATNCGACGNRCASTGGSFTMPVCTAMRTCTTACVAGHGDCDGVSTNGCETSFDAPTTCGACTTRCTTGQACAGRTCCAVGSVGCGGRCVNVESDPTNCGACGTACTAGQLCCGGRCVTGASCSGTYALSTPAVAFVDVCAATVTHRTVLVSTDDGTINVPETTGTPLITVPFQVRAYNVVYAPPFTVASNGWLSLLGSAPLGFLTSAIPSTSPPYMVVAPHWRDMVTRASGICYATLGVAPSRRFVVQWADLYNCCFDDPAVHLTFEVIINEAPVGTNNTFDVVYQNMAGESPPAGMGIENATGAIYTVLPALPATPTAVRYTYVP